MDSLHTQSVLGGDRSDDRRPITAQTDGRFDIGLRSAGDKLVSYLNAGTSSRATT